MSAIVLDGEAVAAGIKQDLRQRIAALAERGVVPGRGTVAELLVALDAGPSGPHGQG